MAMHMTDKRGLLAILVGDGRPLVTLTGLALIGSGLFVSFQAITGHFLPHDEAFLGMRAAELHAYRDGRIVHFMIHDRISFGGAIFAVGTLYLYLAAVPLARGRAWAWWTLLLSGLVGFGSFLAYLGYGYLDTWHGVATLMLLPVFVWGMVKTHFIVKPPTGIRVLRKPGVPLAVALEGRGGEGAAACHVRLSHAGRGRHHDRGHDQRFCARGSGLHGHHPDGVERDQ